MNFHEFSTLVRTDLYRHSGSRGLKRFLTTLLLEPGFTYTFWYRVATYLSNSPIYRWWAGVVARVMLRHYMHKYGIYIPRNTAIGPGLYIGHYGEIVVHEAAIIGRNCNISQGVTIGQTNRGNRKGTPTLGNNVFVGPGAKVIGGVTVGNNVAIGANCVVTKDVPENAVVVGIPAKVLSFEGSGGYVDNTDY